MRQTPSISAAPQGVVEALLVSSNTSEIPATYIIITQYIYRIVVRYTIDLGEKS
jgi:hypothetical protein